MAAPLGFLVHINYKNKSYSYRSNKTNTQEVLQELLEDKTNKLYDWLDVTIKLQRIEPGSEQDE